MTISKTEYTIEFPYSAVIYPDSNSKIPDELLCHILFSDGTSHDYKVPTVKIQKYSLEDIKQKHLTIFLPYKLLQFRPRLNSKKAPITEDELTTFISDIIFILEEEMRFNRISKPQYDNYCDLIKKASETVFIKHKAYKDKVVETMTKSSIVLPSARYREYENEIAEKNVIISNTEQKLAGTEQKLAGTEQKLAGTEQKLAGTEEELHAAQEEIARLKELLAQANKN